MIFNALIAICFTLTNVCLKTYAEVYTSIADVESLLDVRKGLIQDLQFYMDEEEKRISILKQYYDVNKKEHERAMRDIPNYVGSPISAFVMIKSLTVDLKHVKAKIRFGRDLINNVTTKLLYHSAHTSLADLKGVAKGLRRLKKTYNLDVKDLSEGKLNGAAVSTPLSASDCYELGRIIYKAKDYEIGRAFMEEAYHKYNKEQISYPFTDIDILEHIGYGSYLLGDLKYGKTWIDKILRIDPNHKRAKSTRKLFQDELHDVNEERDVESETDNQDNDRKDDFTDEFENFEELCRDNIEISPEISRRLTCGYLTDKHPFLKIAPIKMEMKYLSPDLVLFHDVLSDKEIETIKELAKPRLERAKIIDEDTGEPFVQEDLRISKTALVDEYECDVVVRVAQRISHMTGLSLENTESMQVANYGVGGSYDPHHDFSKVIPDTYTKQGGRRIASILFYLSDVEQGGATVFVKLGVRISPVKGTALFWYNLHPSGEGNHAMQHGACPVLQGSKWLLVRFFHQIGQELRKPCNLEYQEEGFAGSIPKPVLKEVKEKASQQNGVAF